MRTSIDIKKVYVFSHREFDETMKHNGLTSENVGDDISNAYISITSSDDVNENYLTNPWPHYFDGKSDNVLNISFDDIGEDELEHRGVKFFGITESQAKQIVDFIEEHKGKNFFIHCRAGRSRSQGIARYILDMYGEGYGYFEDYSERLENPCITPNQRVVRMLKREFYKQFGYFE